MDARSIIIQPILTEKSNMLREGQLKTYVFKVHRKANKFMVKQAVQELFKVKSVKCCIINSHGKAMRNKAVSKKSFRRGIGRTASCKKAIVTLSKGQSIDVFEGA